MCVRLEATWETVLPSAQLFCDPKAILKRCNLLIYNRKTNPGKSRMRDSRKEIAEEQDRNRTLLKLKKNPLLCSECGCGAVVLGMRCRVWQSEKWGTAGGTCVWDLSWKELRQLS